MRRPVDSPYVITTEFGVIDSYAKFGRHSGVDYAVETGRPVYAPASGDLQNIVSPTGGNMVVIFDGTYWHRLMHNSSFSRGNGRVNEGDEVARVGTTGLSTGPHCHWDVNREGIYPTAFSSFINPADWLAGATQGGTMSTTDLGVARVLAYHILGRQVSPNNALAGQSDADLNANHVGKETNSIIWQFYNSPEGKTFREQRLIQLYGAEANLKNVTADRDGLIKKLSDANATIASKDKEIIDLNTKIGELEDTVAAQQATITAQEAEIKRLNNELSNRPTTPTDESEVVKSWFSRLIDKLTFWSKT